MGKYLSLSIDGSCNLSTTKGTFPFSRMLLDWLVINDQQLPNWVWPTLFVCARIGNTSSLSPEDTFRMETHGARCGAVLRADLMPGYHGLRNAEALHKNHSDRTCGRVIEMDLRTASKSLRVDLGNVLPTITTQPARCLAEIRYVRWKWITREQRTSVSWKYQTPWSESASELFPTKRTLLVG
jgi:hypothetical protein